MRNASKPLHGLLGNHRRTVNNIDKKKWTEHIYIVILPATDYIKFSEPTADGMDDK